VVGVRVHLLLLFTPRILICMESRAVDSPMRHFAIKPYKTVVEAFDTILGGRVIVEMLNTRMIDYNQFQFERAILNHLSEAAPQHAR
jgi:hypothetical protein